MATKRRSSKQSGGTFLGIVLGLIVGLAIAVVVALYITRAPTPFVARVTPSSDASTSAQPAVDPNRILQGKSPGQPVAPQAAQPAPPNTAPGQSSNQSQSSGMLDEPQIVEVPPAAPAATPQQKSAAVPNPVSTPPAPGSAGQNAKPAANGPQKPTSTGYFLQVGAYKTSQDAEQQRARLALQGFEGKVSERNAGSVTYFRVRLGPFTKFEDMNSVRQRLADAGVDTVVIRFTKQ